MTRAEATARCWVEIDLDILRENYRCAVRRAHGARVICVLKADAYGLGAVPVCRALLSAGADMFAVASGDEAEALLDAFPRIDVLVLGLVGAEQAERLIRRNAIFTLFSRRYGETLIEAVRRAGRPARVHLKAETGLARLGFAGDDAPDEIAALVSSGCLQVEGLFTHLALHDRASDEAQLAALDALAEALRARGITIPCLHALDSIGLVRYPERVMDAVRVGAWLYGVRPRGCPEEESRLVAAFKARIAQIHLIPAGAHIGYDDVHTLARDSRVATVSAGYADGVPRYNNEGEVLIRGQRAPVLGLVCMDQMMVDVTDIPEAQEGDEVILFGGDLGIEEYARQGHINHNEALARIGKRVAKTYIDGGGDRISFLWPHTADPVGGVFDKGRVCL